MNCGCTKNLGCFAPCQIINFGFNSPWPDATSVTFEIWTNGGFTTQSVSFDQGDSIQIPFQFNENGETYIKIQVPAVAAQTYFTHITIDGACMFSVTGVPPICQPLTICD